MAIPTGMPAATAMRVETRMMARVRIVSSHMPNQPMAKNVTTTPAVSQRLRLAR